MIIRKTFLSSHKKRHFCCFLSSKTGKLESQGFSFAMTTDETAKPCDIFILSMINFFFFKFFKAMLLTVGKHQVLFAFLM